MTERQKMLIGDLYDPLDAELTSARERARNLCQALNATHEAEQEVRRRILSELFGKGGETVIMQPPFYCDYGSNIELGERVFFNFNAWCSTSVRCASGISRSSALRRRSSPRCTRSTPACGESKSMASRLKSGRMSGWAAAR